MKYMFDKAYDLFQDLSEWDVSSMPCGKPTNFDRNTGFENQAGLLPQMDPLLIFSSWNQYSYMFYYIDV